jgi:2-amino-4-hydroxy-6-hydroxymethyldihydropteridine diphosphokinase
VKTAILLLGSNQGNREKLIEQALKSIANHAGVITGCSGIYETEPWGDKDQQNFLNVAISVTTTHSPQKLLKELLTIEEKMGRVRNKKWEPRTIDIDILFYNNEIISEEGLKIPHPLLHERRFALTALTDIIPDFIHPVLHKKISQLYIECNDSQSVYLFRTGIKTDDIS